MKLVLAPDSFKGTLSAPQVADAMEAGLKQVWPRAAFDKIPLADGGEGTTEALVKATGGVIKKVDVTGPLGSKVGGFFGILGDGNTAVIEMAAASGIMLVPKEKQDPIVTTSRGTGELMRAALDAGCTRMIVGIGGSATNDGGVGMAQALGASFRDRTGKELAPGGAALLDLEDINLDSLDRRLQNVEVIVACDVDNPLVGPQGASRVYGPQKGATPADVERLDQALSHLAQKIEAQLGLDVWTMPGGGAAGGLGAGLVAFLGARLTSGIDLILDAVEFRERIRNADLVVTGEGLIDDQTVHGKVPFGVLQVARRIGVPVVAIAGGIGGDINTLVDQGFAAVIDCTPRPMTIQEVTMGARDHIIQTAATVARLVSLHVGGKLGAMSQDVSENN